MIRIVDKRQCCGCAACVQKCPKHCISFYEDEEGFLYPRIDTNNCIDCGLCEKVCPFLNCDKAVPPQAPAPAASVLLLSMLSFSLALPALLYKQTCYCFNL